MKTGEGRNAGKRSRKDKWEAVTYYRILDSNNSTALLECQPESGIPQDRLLEMTNYRSLVIIHLLDVAPTISLSCRDVTSIKMVGCLITSHRTYLCMHIQKFQNLVFSYGCGLIAFCVLSYLRCLIQLQISVVDCEKLQVKLLGSAAIPAKEAGH